MLILLLSSPRPLLHLPPLYTTRLPQPEGEKSCLTGADGAERPSRVSPEPSNVDRAHPKGHSQGRLDEEMHLDEAASGGVFLDDAVDTPAGNFEQYVSLGSESSL